MSLVTADALAATLLETTSQPAQQADPELAASAIAEALRRDPAFALFAVCEYVSRHRVKKDSEQHQLTLVPFERRDESSSLELYDLAMWLHPLLVEIFADGDRRLLTESLAQQIEESADSDFWCELACESLAAGFAELLSTIERWLRPSRLFPPASFLAAWPELCEAGCETIGIEQAKKSTNHGRSLGYGLGTFDLWRLARQGSRLRSLESQFAVRLRAEKLESLRQFAYGLSHEINNPLAAVRVRAEQLAGGEQHAERREQLGKIVNSVMRAHEMIAELMYFAKPPRPDRQRCCAIAITEEVVESYRHECERRSIQLSVQSKVKARCIEADRGQIADALRSLLDNAMEAVDRDGAIQVAVNWASRKVQWVVSDSGPGLSAEARRHAFDPYYSGREAGRGLGLGLCRVYRVAKGHGGGAALDDAPVGCRARFWIARTCGSSTSD